MIDLDRMKESLESGTIDMPSGLTREQDQEIKVK